MSAAGRLHCLKCKIIYDCKCPRYEGLQPECLHVAPCPLYKEGFDWVNKDIIRMAESLEKQIEAIQDEEEFADTKRAHLHRAIGHLHMAFAELTSCPVKL